jgi:hypothetical protein
LRDLSVHARLLVAIPLLVHADRMLEARCASAVGQLYRGRFAPRGRLESIIDRAEQLRRSSIAELAIALVAIAAGQLALWGPAGRTGVFAGGLATGGATFARIWYATVGLPIVQFLWLDWLWQWAIWTYVVVAVARLPLATIATHPDEAAGIGFLADPLAAFAGFMLAASVIMAAAWGTELANGQLASAKLAVRVVVILAVAYVVACGPLFVYAGTLYRTRFADGRAYHELALDFMRAFHRNWIETPRAGDELQGRPDVRSLDGMIQAVGHVDRVRLVPFRARAVIAIWAATIAPILPIAVTVMPPDELVKKLGDALLAGLPM